MPNHKKVLVTGASGFIALHIIKVLLDRGFTVVGTVRSQEKADALHKVFKGRPFETVFVKDMSVSGAFDHVFKNDKDITAVLHTASPLAGKTHPKDVIVRIAVEGTKNVLNAIKSYAPQVTHVIYTSSIAAVSRREDSRNPNITIDEDTWNSVTYAESQKSFGKAYMGSKTFAEREFWRFIKEENVNFTGNAINPPMVFGPFYPEIDSPKGVTGSNAVLLSPLFDKVPASFDFTEGTGVFVDVRDLAIIHVLCLEKPELAGKRFLPIDGYYSPQMVLDVANEKFPQLRGKIPVGEPGTGSRRVPGMFKYNGSKTDRLLNLKHRKFEDTVLDTLRSYKGFENYTVGN